MHYHRYLITPMPHAEFEVGHTDDGGQLLIGPTFSDVVAYRFDDKGQLLRRERRPWRASAGSDTAGVHWLFGAAEREQVQTHIADWQRELGYVPGTLAVERFYDPDFAIGIEDMPRQLEAPTGTESAEELHERIQLRHAWAQSGRFVFWWGVDYWMWRERALHHGQA